MENVIETLNLTKRFNRMTAVDAVSFTVGRGQVFGFLGPNGSGKTTTIGMLLNIIAPSSGEIRLLGRHGYMGLNEARKRVGATLEQPNFYPHLSAYDNLRVSCTIKGVPDSKIDPALETAGLLSRRKDSFEKYSLGMKQRLAIASALLGDPELLFLDEPMNGLDPEGMREVRDLIVRLNEQGRTVFLSSHLLHEVERSCTHVAVIKKGRILTTGSLAEILGRNIVAAMRCADVLALRTALAAYPAAVNISQDSDIVLAELSDGDLAALNGFLAARGVLLSYLAPRHKSLEDVFMEVTQDPDPLARPTREEVAA